MKLSDFQGDLLLGLALCRNTLYFAWIPFILCVAALPSSANGPANPPPCALFSYKGITATEPRPTLFEAVRPLV
jgi:hypothetical protein